MSPSSTGERPTQAVVETDWSIIVGMNPSQRLTDFLNQLTRQAQLDAFRNYLAGFASQDIETGELDVSPPPPLFKELTAAYVASAQGGLTSDRVNWSSFFEEVIRSSILRKGAKGARIEVPSTTDAAAAAVIISWIKERFEPRGLATLAWLQDRAEQVGVESPNAQAIRVFADEAYAEMWAEMSKTQKVQAIPHVVLAACWRMVARACIMAQGQGSEGQMMIPTPPERVQNR